MPYYKEKKMLFIHIPKTGGTNIEASIKKYTPQTLFSGRSNKILPKPYNRVSLQHQIYTTIYQYRDILDVNFDNIKIFTVVRNPYDRIISDLFWHRLIKKNFTPEQVFNVIKNKYLNRTNLDNHNIPQFKFIVDENSELIKDIKIFKTETLNKSNRELSEIVGFDINIRKKEVNKNYSNYLNKDSISLINTYYKKDFELFNYKLESAF